MNKLDDAPQDASFRSGRRGFVLGAVACAAALALAKPQAFVFAADADFKTSAFMTVSRLISSTLDLRTGEALYEALRHTPDFDADLRALANLAAAPGMTIEALAAQLDATQQKALRDTLNEVVAAWYLGIVENRTYAYQSALMYRPTADVLSPPSYVRAGPLSWATSTPPAEGF
jgi:fructose 5-dehydrogenase small subunit